MKFLLKNKAVTITVIISICGVVLLGVCTAFLMKTAKNRNQQENTQAASESTSVSETSDTATEASTATTATSVTKISTTVIPTSEKEDIPEINSDNVRKLFTPLLRYYSSLKQDTHYAVGLDCSKDYRAVLPKSWYDETGMTDMAIERVHKFKTVKSKQELKNIYRKYLSLNILNKYDIDNNNHIVVIENEMYLVEGARGTYEYDATSIKFRGKQDGGYLISADSCISGSYLSTEYFLVKYEKGQVYYR